MAVKRIPRYPNPFKLNTIEDIRTYLQKLFLSLVQEGSVRLRDFEDMEAQTDHGALTGLTDDDHTQYIKKSLMTEQGDILYASAASTPTALHHGTSGQVLATGGSAANPSWVDIGVGGTTHHGGLTGLGDDDHTQYLLADGTRDLTGYLATLKSLDLQTKKPWADVRAFGAVGNGVTDDTTAIRAAVTYIDGLGGGIVFFPAGTYLTQAIYYYDNITFLGVGQGVTILKLKASSDSPIFTRTDAIYNPATSANDLTAMDNVTIGKMTLDGNYSEQTTCPISGLYESPAYLVRVRNPLIYDCEIKNGRCGGIFYLQCVYGHILNNYIHGNTRGLSNQNEVNIVRDFLCGDDNDYRGGMHVIAFNHVDNENHTNADQTWGTCISLVLSTSSIIIGNTCYPYKSWGVTAESCCNNVIANNTVNCEKHGYGMGIKSTLSTTGITGGNIIAFNTVKDPSWPAFDTGVPPHTSFELGGQTTPSAIIGNVTTNPKTHVSGVQEYNIVLRNNTSSVLVQGNRIGGVTSDAVGIRGIYIYNCNDVDIKDNYIETYEDHGIYAHATNGSYFTFSGNRFVNISSTQTGTYGIYLQSSYCNIVSNVFDNFAVGLHSVGSTSKNNLAIGNRFPNCAANITEATQGNIIYGLVNGKKVYYKSTSAPSTGTWVVGDICWKINPSSGSEPGWVCTTEGTPGTWSAMANLA